MKFDPHAIRLTGGLFGIAWIIHVLPCVTKVGVVRIGEIKKTDPGLRDTGIRGSQNNLDPIWAPQKQSGGCPEDIQDQAWESLDIVQSLPYTILLGVIENTYARSVIVVDHTGPSPAITPERGN